MSRAARPRQCTGLHPQIAGIAGSFELALRFTAWCSSLGSDPTVAQIKSRWDVSVATAYRWRAGWLAAKGRV